MMGELGSQSQADMHEPDDRAPSGTVLLVANYRPDVGFAWWLMENFWIRFANVARARGLHPLIVYPTDGVIPQAIVDAGVETAVQPFPGTGRDGLAAAVELVRQRRVRCIYFTDRPFSKPAYAALRAAGVRLIINHDHSPGDRPPVGGLKGLAKAVWRRMRPMSCDLQLCVAPLIRERAIRNARIPADRAVLVQNGIVPIECGGDRGYARRVLGLPDDATICITVGRASTYKRIDFVIEVARHCIAELNIDDIHFVHCGDGPDMDRLRGLVDAAGLNDRFILAGRRSDVKELLCSSDFAMHAAKGEAFSLAIIEYMSAGLPVLVPDIPSVRQAIRHEENGLVYPDGDARAAAQLLAGLHADPARRHRLGAKAAADVREHYTLDTMNARFDRVVDDALARIR